MSSYSKTILWLGLIMVLLQIAMDWAQISADLFLAPPSSATGIGGTTTAFGEGVVYAATGGAISPTNAGAFVQGLQTGF